MPIFPFFSLSAIKKTENLILFLFRFPSNKVDASVNQRIKKVWPKKYYIDLPLHITGSRSLRLIFANMRQLRSRRQGRGNQTNSRIGSPRWPEIKERTSSFKNVRQ